MVISAGSKFDSDLLAILHMVWPKYKVSLLRPGLVESTYRVHMRSESGQWLLKVYEVLSVKINQQNF